MNTLFKTAEHTSINILYKSLPLPLNLYCFSKLWLLSLVYLALDNCTFSSLYFLWDQATSWAKLFSSLVLSWNKITSARHTSRGTITTTLNICYVGLILGNTVCNHTTLPLCYHLHQVLVLFYLTQFSEGNSSGADPGHEWVAPAIRQDKPVWPWNREEGQSKQNLCEGRTQCLHGERVVCRY